jgi:tetratricopeptide (TPR) repeat protein
MPNVQEILEKARSSGQRLSAHEAAVLYAAVVRLASAQGTTLRGRLVEIDESGGLHLEPFDDQAAEEEPGYLAPELLGADPPRKGDPRVQVYAAGALGYELLTGQRNETGRAPGPELTGPLGDIVRMALAADRRERFGDLTQLYDAIEVVQPRPPAEGERQIFGALRARSQRAGLEKEALAKVIEKLGQIEAQLPQLGKAQSKLESAQRQVLERIDRAEGGQKRTEEVARQKPSMAAPVAIAAVLGAAGALGVGLALGMIELPSALRPPRPEPARTEALHAEPSARPSAPVPLNPSPGAAKTERAEKTDKTEKADASALALAPADAGLSDAGALAAPNPAVDAGLALSPPVTDAGPVKVAAAEPPPPAPKAPEPEPPGRRRGTEVSQAAMVHAVALSQVKAGETALERGRVNEAIGRFHAALENEPNIAQAYRGLGMAYAMQSNDGQALQAYEKYLRLAPKAADAVDIRRSIAELKTRSKIGAGEEK